MPGIVDGGDERQAPSSARHPEPSSAGGRPRTSRSDGRRCGPPASSICSQKGVCRTVEQRLRLRFPATGSRGGPAPTPAPQNRDRFDRARPPARNRATTRAPGSPHRAVCLTNCWRASNSAPGEPGLRPLRRHLPIPAGAGELRQALGVVGVGLVHPAGERRLGPTCVDDRHRQAGRRQLTVQPARLPAGLQRPPPTASGARSFQRPRQAAPASSTRAPAPAPTPALASTTQIWVSFRETSNPTYWVTVTLLSWPIGAVLLNRPRS